MHDKKHKLTIFFGDIDQSLANTAKQFDESAWLLDHSNYKKFVANAQNQYTVVYTSLGELPKDLGIVYLILSQADTVVYCPPAVWSDNKVLNFEDPGNSMQGLTEIILSMLPDSIKVENLKPAIPVAIPLVDTRKCDHAQLWNVGCSISHGAGVDLSQRYGQLLADELNMQCSFLTRDGSAIDWAADQILRSDINEKDIVVWGITSPERLTYIHNNQLLKGVTVTAYDNYPEYKKIINPSNLYSQNTIYRHFYAIQQVINYCKKIKAHLIFVDLLAGHHSIQRIIRSYKNCAIIDYKYRFEKNCINTKFIDLGTDHIHPGYAQHNRYKEIILKKLKQLEII
jgi:hypothetical protein